jgi:uncharacterized FAD-dependent dehydrogenase
MKTLNIQVSPPAAENKSILEIELKNYGFDNSRDHFKILKKSIDARGKKIKINLRIGILPVSENFEPLPIRNFSPRDYSKTAIIIGAGPAGLFAALRLIELGIKPIVIERGKDVRSRRRDLALITRHGIVNENSNYCFGEGGAGTYSDGKLYTRSTKKGSVTRILETFVQFGAHENILIESHPHIGTNKLPHIISEMRETIISAGGEVLFQSKMIDFTLNENRIQEIQLESGDTVKGDYYVLATGHSARDIFKLLDSKQVKIEYKPFAIGFRIEHQQLFIDQQQYHCKIKDENLPPASYSVVTQTHERAVYSFCMCPGGIVAPCATSPEEIVTNGWSPSKRNNEWANSGIVGEVNEADLKEYIEFGELRGMKLQEFIERKAFILGGAEGSAPAQLAIDFIENRESRHLKPTSYKPGISSVNLNTLFPKALAASLRDGLIQIEKKIPGFTRNALLIAPETRTSSPVRIPRDTSTFVHPEIKNLFPCGEGAGYAGGIISAAIDGERVAEAIASSKC